MSEKAMWFKHIKVSTYNSLWPALFEQEAARITNALFPKNVEIYPIGSTSLPGLSAKPILDRIAGVADGSVCIQALEDIGYRYKGKVSIPAQGYKSLHTKAWRSACRFYEKKNYKGLDVQERVQATIMMGIKL